MFDVLEFFVMELVSNGQAQIISLSVIMNCVALYLLFEQFTRLRVFDLVILSVSML